MLNTKCPYCHTATMPAPPRRGPLVYVECPTCKLRPRAKFTDTANGDVIVEYVSTRNFVVGDGLVMLTVRVKPETYQRARKAGSKKLREILEGGLGDE